MTGHKFDWITGKDLIVMYVFDYCVEANINELDTDELRDILLGATDLNQKYFDGFSDVEVQIVLKRIQYLLQKYYMFKDAVQCSLCEELSEVEMELVNEFKGIKISVELCETHFTSSIENPGKFALKVFKENLGTKIDYIEKDVS